MVRNSRNLFTRLIDLFREDQDAGPLRDSGMPEREWIRVSRKGKLGLLISPAAPDYANEVITKLRGEKIGDAYFFDDERTWEAALRHIINQDNGAVRAATPDGSTRMFDGSRLYLAHDAQPPGFRRVDERVIAANPGSEATPEQVGLFVQRDNVSKAKHAYRHHGNVRISDDGDITMPAHEHPTVIRAVIRMGGTADGGVFRIPGEKVRNGEFRPQEFIGYIGRVERQAERDAEQKRRDGFLAMGVDVSKDPAWVSRDPKNGDASFRVAGRGAGLIKAMTTAGAAASTVRGGDVLLTFPAARFAGIAPIMPWVEAERKRANGWASGHSEKDVAARLEGVTKRARSRAGGSAPAGFDLLDPANPLSIINPLSPLNPASAFYDSGPSRSGSKSAEAFPAEPESSSSGGYSPGSGSSYSSDSGPSYSSGSSYESSSSSSSYDSGSSSSFSSD